MAATATLAAFQATKSVLDASYAASKHPVDYATGQTTFSGPRIKEYYATMLDAGTLDIYRMTQLIDFGFIAAMACMGLFVCSLIARIGRDGSWARRIGFWAAGAIVLGALSDAIENAWSFVMLANPTGFADWLALPYSGFASAKFALITLGMVLTIASLLTGLAGRLAGKPQIG
ncbi:MAG TPA: hypothetical protein PKE65_09460 [Rhizobiaceae bacterium]|nr:hypothetical protein [Rhizobiaceae bacterium]